MSHFASNFHIRLHCTVQHCLEHWWQHTRLDRLPWQQTNQLFTTSFTATRTS